MNITIDNWHYYKSIQKNTSEHSDFEVAQSFFYLNRTNISGVIKGGPIGGLNQNGKYKVDARFNKSDLIKRIERINKFKHRIKISNNDGLKFINQLNKLNQNIFIYLDPPYVHKGADLYMNYYKKKDHHNLAKKVEQIRHKWLVSYDNNEFILNLYSKQQRLIYKLSQSASNRVGNEVLIFSDELKFSSSVKELSQPILV